MMLLLMLMCMLHDTDAANFVLTEQYMVVVKTDKAQVMIRIIQNTLMKYVLKCPVHDYTSIILPTLFCAILHFASTTAC